MKVALHDETYVPVFKQFSFLYIPGLYLITAILLDVVMYACMLLPFPSYYVYSFALMLMVAAVTCLFRRKWIQIIILSIFLGMQLFTCVANIVTYASLYEVFSLETIISIGNVVGAADSVDVNMGFVIPVLTVMLIFVCGTMLVVAKCRVPRTKRRFFWQPVLALLLAVMCLFGNATAYSSLPAYDKNYIRNLSNQKFTYDTFCNRVISLQSYGSYSFYLNNLLYLFQWTTPLDKALQVNNADYDPVVPDYEYQLSDGNNLIMILMETFERAAINPITMPNTYQFLQQACWEVDGYYSVERTCFTDYVGQTGMHVLGREMWSNYGDVQVPFALGNMFQRSGYVTRAFHDYSGSSYQRRKLFTGVLGFQEFYDYNDYETQHYNDWAGNRDEDLFKQNLDKMAPADQKFYSYIITVSTHGISPSHDLSSIYPEAFALIDQHLDELAETYQWLKSDQPNERQAIKNYLAGTYSFDQGFGALLNHLRTTKDSQGRYLIDTTAIVMFGDHYSYMNPNMVKPEITNPQNLVGNRCPFIIYNPKTPEAQCDVAEPAERTAELGRTIEHETALNHFTATMDIYQTVCALFGITTDRQITYGHAVFGTEESIGVGYMNGFIWGRTANGELWRTVDFTKFTGKILSQAEINQIAPRVNQTFASIVFDMRMFERDGFKNLDKCNNTGAYRLPTV